MSGISKKLMGTTAAGAEFLAVEDVFQSWLYTGNGSTQTITNGIDLAGEGGLVWGKMRSGADNHNLFDTERGATSCLFTDQTNAQSTVANLGVTAFNADGFSVAGSRLNASGFTYASWTFRKAPRFFDVVTYTGNGVAGRQIPHNLGCEVGHIIVKNYGTTRAWINYHRTLGGTHFMELNNTNPAIGPTLNVWNNTDATDTHFTVGTNTSTNAAGNSYVAYLFAHDPLGPSGDGSDGLIACGSYSSTGFVELGWEPQWILTKSTTDTGDYTGDWRIFDNMRGIIADDDKQLFASSSRAEDSTSFASAVRLESTGFTVESQGNYGTSTIYIAIRRGPMRQPTSGTEVFAPLAFTSTGDDLNTLGKPVDVMWTGRRAFVAGDIGSRLQGNKYFVTNTTAPEASFTSGSIGFFWDNNTSVRQVNWWNQSGNNMINYVFRRAPGFFDVVAYTGDGVAGRTVPHNLGVAPEMMIVKSRTDTRQWRTYVEALGPTKFLELQSTAAAVTQTLPWNDTAPTATEFTLGATTSGNAVGQNYIWYGFATLPGVSKVGSYTGNGSSQTIDCGFTSGARFVLIKRTDSTGDWYVWDTARGIVAANDPHLSLNTTAAEVTTDDSVDPASSGFIVNQVAATNINVNAASYIFYAIA